MTYREGLVFGTAGIPYSSQGRSSQAGIERIYELGLGCMEVEFVRGINMNPQTARAAAEVAAAKGIRLSAHAPYFINLNAQEPSKLAASREQILRTARITASLGGRSVVFHPAYYLKDTPAGVYHTVKRNLESILAQLKAEGISVCLRPEVMGKVTAFGTLSEILELSLEIEGVAPAIDFAHWHARTGKANSYDEFMSILKQVEGKLGSNALEDMHLHVSGIEYGERGEIRHLMFAEADLQYIELVKALKDYGVKGSVICESPNPEEDALLLQATYRAL